MKSASRDLMSRADCDENGVRLFRYDDSRDCNDGRDTGGLGAEVMLYLGGIGHGAASRPA